jgi:hypothetical protein
LTAAVSLDDHNSRSSFECREPVSAAWTCPPAANRSSLLSLAGINDPGVVRCTEWTSHSASVLGTTRLSSGHFHRQDEVITGISMTCPAWRLEVVRSLIR